MASNGSTMKTVRYAADLCSYHEGAVMDIESVREVDVWYQAEELQCIKREAIRMSKRCTSSHFGGLLSNSYGSCSDDVVEAMNKWATSCESLRGLEKFANKDFGEKRTGARRRTIEVILTAQNKMRSEGSNENAYITRVLGRLSESFSQNYAQFAAVMGRADMLVVTQCDHIDSRINCDFADSHKIVLETMMIRDAITNNSSGHIHSSKEKLSSRSSPFRSRNTRISRKNAQREFTEMRYCF